MKICSPCLFYDNEDHIWRFYINDNNELMYSIMYAQDKWTKETKIDNEVLDFIVSLDIDNKIYIIYSDKTSNLKYCEWEKNKWIGKTIYTFENQEYEMNELNVITIGKLMHIFFIGKNSLKKNQCSLMHLCLNDDSSLFNTIDTIIFSKDIFFHYQVQTQENDNLSLIFVSHEKDEGVIKFTKFKNNKWSNPKRLYGIIGNNINFNTLIHLNKINIMNVSKEGSLYFIEHVVIEPDGKMKSFKIYEGRDVPTNFLLAEISGVLWSIWAQGKNVFTSSYNFEWSPPSQDYTQLDDEILLYKYLSICNNNNNINSKYVLGTIPPEIILLLPNYKNSENIIENQETSILNLEPELDYDLNLNKTDIREELLSLQKNNKNLEKELIALQMKYQQKLRIIEEFDNNFAKLINAKKKAEEKLTIIAEIQQNSIKKLKVMETEKIYTDIVINELKDKSIKLTNENDGLNEQKINKNNVVTELKSRLDQLTSEKEDLRQDLRYEKNIGIVDRILKKRPMR